MPSITILIVAVVILLGSYLLTGAVIRIAPKIGLICRPNHRSSHTGMMPHGGGIGFVVPFLVFASLMFYFGYLPKSLWLVIAGCGGLIFVVGLWDDIADTPVVLRLLVQLVCVSMGVWLLGGSYASQSTGLITGIGTVGSVLSVLILIWWLNLFNFMDGIDGLAGAEAIFIALGAILMVWFKYRIFAGGVPHLTEAIELLLFFASVSVFGFLVHNWAPARVFMGDAGSTFLGFALGMIALSSIASGAISLSVWLILGAVFWVDATFTLMRRILAGERWYLAHKSHAYQHAISLINNADKEYGSKIIKGLFFVGEKYTHKRVSLLILTINLFWLLPLACWAVAMPEQGLLIVFLAWTPLVWIVFRLGAGKESTMSNDFMPSWPEYSKDEVNAVSEVLCSGKVNYWTGNNGREFEREFAAYCGAAHGIALANGTVALELALKMLGIGPEDEVIVPPRTFIATVSSVALCGAVPVFADVDRESQNISPDAIRKCITPRTKAIIVVHLAGWPCDMDPIMEIVKEHGLKLIEDCAQAHGASYKGKAVGSFGDMAAFSFCQDKIVTTGGEGGMLLTGSPDLWARAWAYKDHGKSYDAIYLREQNPDDTFRWVHESFGTNWRMTEMQSVIGRIQLTKLDKWVACRRANANILAKRLSISKALRVPMPEEEFYHSYYKFYAFIRPERLKAGWTRDRLINAINDKGIPCFYGSCSEVYEEKAFDATGLRPAERLPIAKELGETSIMFPVHPPLTEMDLHRIADAVDEVLAEATD